MFCVLFTFIKLCFLPLLFCLELHVYNRFFFYCVYLYILCMQCEMLMKMFSESVGVCVCVCALLSPGTDALHDITNF